MLVAGWPQWMRGCVSGFPNSGCARVVAWVMDGTCSEAGLHRLGFSPCSGSDAFWHPRGTRQSRGPNWECIRCFRAHRFSEERKPCCSYKMPKPVQEVPDFQGLFHRDVFPPFWPHSQFPACSHCSCCLLGIRGKSLSEVKQLKSL